MRQSKYLISGVALVVAGGLSTLSFLRGQGQPVPSAPGPSAGVAPTIQRPVRDLSKWPFFQKQIFLSGQRGSEWLQRHNKPDGRFVPGFVPALRVPLEGDSYVRQAGAACALAKAATYYADDKAGAVARQAVLTLLLDTAIQDATNPVVRVCMLPGGMVDQLGAAAALARAIHALPMPAGDVLEQSDQLCHYIRLTQRQDGALVNGVEKGPGQSGGGDTSIADVGSTEALSALMQSQLARPAPWKLEAIQRSLAYYQGSWRGKKNLLPVPSCTEAFAEAFLQTGDKSYATFVFEMNDWLCTFQYQQNDPQHPLWLGGFMGCSDGKPTAQPPHATSAAYARSLVQAARVARKTGDVQRWDRYKAALERSLQFLMTLQYTEANTQHFADWYRPVLLGAVHASHADGNIRLDYTHEAVCAMVSYLTYIAETP